MTTVTLHARVFSSDEAAPPLVLLHGLFGSWENLGSLAKGLSADYVVHALDLRNHGRSPHTDAMNYTLMAQDVLAYMQAQGLEKAHIVGHSMGGKTAMQLALIAAEKVMSVIAIDIAPVTYPPGHLDILEGLRTLPLHEITSRHEADVHLKAFVPELPVRQFLLKNLVKSGMTGFAWRMNLAAIDRQYNEVRIGVDAHLPFTGPILFIKGGHSDYIDRSHQPHIERLFPGAQLRVIPNTGHWLHAEKPETVLQICLRFLQGKTSTSSQK